MSLRSRFLIPVIFFGGLAVLLLIVATIQGEYERAKAQLLENNQQFLAFYLQQEKAVLESIGEAVAQNSQIIQAINEGDRNRVYQELKALWDGYQQKQKLVEMSLFRPAAILWLNMSEPDTYGDDTCDVRGDIVSISDSGERNSHLHVCSSFAGLRAVIPIRRGKEILAVLSIGKRLSDIPRQLSEKLGKKHCSFMTKHSFKTV